MSLVAGSRQSLPLPPPLAVATTNAGKLRELTILIGNAATLRPLSELALTLPEETGASFEENARAKANLVASATGLLTIADDSGLEVDVLNGAPGIHTARFAGPEASDDENRLLLLERLKGIPPSRRSAQFVCVIALADGRGNTITVSGRCRGSIAVQEAGYAGFGYDPIFELGDGRTMAELTAREKNAISHRGIALRAALPLLVRSLPSGALQLESQVDTGAK